jgi:hypothetical protein
MSKPKYDPWTGDDFFDFVTMISGSNMLKLANGSSNSSSEAIAAMAELEYVVAEKVTNLSNRNLMFYMRVGLTGSLMRVSIKDLPHSIRVYRENATTISPPLYFWPDFLNSPEEFYTAVGKVVNQTLAAA